MNCINPTLSFSLSADDTTILYQVEELPYWELNEENCLAVLAKKPVDQLGSGEGSGDEEYDAYQDPDEAVVTGEGAGGGDDDFDYGELDEEDEDADKPSNDEDDYEYYPLGTASEDGSFASFYHR